MQTTVDAVVRPWARGAAALVLLAAGCATGPGNVVVAVAPYVAQSSAVAGSRGIVRIDPATNARREAPGALVGQRTGLANTAMGTIETNPPPAALVTNVIRAELAAMGFAAGEAAGVPRVASQLVKFQIATPATALYWDVNGAIELDLAATGANGRKHETRYAVQCTGRTYAWPGEDVIGGVIASCLKELGGKVKADAALAGTLDAR